MRADTLDLQDQDNPSAQEHLKHPQSNTVSPHVQAQVQHVIEERHSEEQSLAEAWSIADANLADVPNSNDQATASTPNNDHNVTNGASQDGDSSHDEEEDMDDDMMDRISSSPSIDDGGYIRNALFVRDAQDRPSLSPTAYTPTQSRASFNQTARTTPASSPFLITPRHMLPRSRMLAPSDFLHTPLQQSSSSKSEGNSDEVVCTPASPSRKLFAASEHHRKGRYGQDSGWTRDSPIAADSKSHMDDRYDSPESSSDEGSYQDAHEAMDHTSRSPISSPFRSNPFKRFLTDLQDDTLERSPSLSSINTVDLESVLLPLDDPLLEHSASPTCSNQSWESVPDSLLDIDDS
jgi:hypothetical protein